MTVKEAAKRARVSTATMLRWIGSGKVKAHRYSAGHRLAGQYDVLVDLPRVAVTIPSIAQCLNLSQSQARRICKRSGIKKTGGVYRPSQSEVGSILQTWI